MCFLQGQSSVEDRLELNYVGSDIEEFCWEEYFIPEVLFELGHEE